MWRVCVLVLVAHVAVSSTAPAYCGKPCQLGNNDCPGLECSRCDPPFGGHCERGYPCDAKCHTATDCDQLSMCNKCVNGVVCGAVCWSRCNNDTQCKEAGCHKCIDHQCQLTSCDEPCTSDADCKYGGCTMCSGNKCRPRQMVFFNGAIYTGDPAQPTVEALCVTGHNFTAVGTYDAVKVVCPNPDDLEDLQGTTVLPGLVDAHSHLTGLGHALLQADLVGSSSKEDVVQRLQDFVREHPVPQGGWLRGRGWNQVLWPGGNFPTREDLDSAFPDIPIWLTRVDGHAGWCNTAALKAVPPLPSQDPEGGEIIRDSEGNPTGVLLDTAMGYVTSHIPPYSDEDEDRGLELALAACAAAGITGVHEMGVQDSVVQRYKRFVDAGRFTLRDYVCRDSITSQPTDAMYDLYGRHLTVRCVKWYLDGALGSWGAAMLEPYTDKPDTRGLLRYTQSQFLGNVSDWFARGWQLCSHAIGDHANRVVLDVYEKLLADETKRLGVAPDRRLRVEHAQIVSLDDMDRFASIPATPSVQPVFVMSDKNMAEERVGPQRILGAYAWGSMLKAGVQHMPFGSDFPVDPLNPLLGLFVAITRQDTSNQPPGGWYPDQRLTRAEALKGFTYDTAWAAFQETSLGSITAGKMADFIIVDRDIFTVPESDIWKTSVLRTFVGGDEVYRRA